MLRKFLRFIFTILGGLIGYGIYALGKTGMTQAGINISDYLTSRQEMIVALLLGIIFAFIFFRLVPIIYDQGKKVAEGIGNDLQGISGSDLLSAILGLVIGLLVAFLLSQIYSAIPNRIVFAVVSIITYLVLGYLGVVVAITRGKDVFAQIFNKNRDQIQDSVNSSSGSRFSVGGVGKKKNAALAPKILDTSVIIDGRIAEIMKTGFLEGTVVIPEFVLVELRHIADSSDALKRARGRRGLDILNKIQNDYGIEIYNTESEKALKDITEVDVKLLKLAQIMNGKVVTNDFNLNKVAKINGVEVLNINELANTLKPVVIPGEKMTVTPVKEGKDPAQSIAYLDDGTMVVLEDGREEIGNTCEITVTSVLQTAAGRMIFGRLKV